MVKGVTPLSSSKVQRSVEPTGPILLMGAPGVGKGTQAKILMAQWGVPQISTGDILRANVAAGTELGVLAGDLMKRGDLVPDDLVNKMVAARLDEPDARTGYLLDGFPRTLGQANWLDQYLEGGLKLADQSLPVIAVNIRVEYTLLMRRITGRRSCPVCQTIYNIYLQPPKRDMVCDNDGTTLVQRSDDTEQVFTERMRAYEELTAPVARHYESLGRFREVDGEQSVQAVTAEIVAAVHDLRSALA